MLALRILTLSPHPPVPPFGHTMANALQYKSDAAHHIGYFLHYTRIIQVVYYDLLNLLALLYSLFFFQFYSPPPATRKKTPTNTAKND